MHGSLNKTYFLEQEENTKLEFVLMNPPCVWSKDPAPIQRFWVYLDCSGVRFPGCHEERVLKSNCARLWLVQCVFLKVHQCWVLVPRSSVFLGVLTEEVFITSNKRMFKTVTITQYSKAWEKFELYPLQPFSCYRLVIIAAAYLHSFCFQEATLRGKRKQWGLKCWYWQHPVARCLLY